MEALGIDLGIILVQVINFGILVFVLNKFLYKPVLKAVKAKQAEVAVIEESKVALDSEAQLTEKKREEIILAAESEKSEVVKEARLKSEATKKEVIEKAQAEAKDILVKAKKEIDAEKAKLKATHEKEVLEAAFAIAEKVIGKSVDKKEIEKAYKELSFLKREVRSK